MDNVFVERLWRSIKYEEVYLKAYQNGTEARKGIGAYLAFYNQERPHQALGYRSPGQVFQAVSPQRCLLEHPRALPSDEGLRDTPAVDSLLATCPNFGVHLKVPDDPVAELEPVLSEHGVEDGVKGDDLSVVDVVPNLPADRPLRMEDSDTLAYDTFLRLKVIVERSLSLVVFAQIVGG